MENIVVGYWSQSGNTEVMAKAIGEGVEEAGKKVQVLNIADISIDDLKKSTTFALGCPSMGVEELEEDEMEPFVEKVESFAAGKNIALFGSYGWGDGDWMRDWVERMGKAGAVVLNGEGLIAQEEPDESIIKNCKNIGKQLAEA